MNQIEIAEIIRDQNGNCKYPIKIECNRDCPIFYICLPDININDEDRLKIINKYLPKKYQRYFIT